MQLAKNPITKTLNEKLKYKDFKNINKLLSDEDRLNDFQFNLGDLNVDITRQSLDKEIKDDLIKLAKKSNIKEKIKAMNSGSKINFSENRSVDHLNLRKVERFNTQEWDKLVTFTNSIFLPLYWLKSRGAPEISVREILYKDWASFGAFNVSIS